MAKKKKTEESSDHHSIEKPKKKGFKKKKSKKNKTIKSDGDTSNEETKIKSASKYLNDWSEQLNWKFNKSQQTWLLKSWRSQTYITDQDFVIFCNYIEKLPEKSFAREKLITETNAIIKQNESDPVDGYLEERARSILQHMV